MVIIMLGAPGSGKGTIGGNLCRHFGLKSLATGDIFREEIKNETELGKEANKYISKGKLVPDEVTIAMVEGKLDKMDNVLLDGFPRTIKQANVLKEYLAEKNKNVTAVINLNVPDEDLIKRTSSRVICPNKECRASFNTIFMPPRVEGICDRCGSTLIKRPDDDPEIIRDRIAVYYESTEPLLEYYKNEGLLEQIDIDIYSPTTQKDTTEEAIKRINSHIS